MRKYFHNYDKMKSMCVLSLQDTIIHIIFKLKVYFACFCRVAYEVNRQISKHLK